MTQEVNKILEAALKAVAEKMRVAITRVVAAETKELRQELEREQQTIQKMAQTIKRECEFTTKLRDCPLGHI